MKNDFLKMLLMVLTLTVIMYSCSGKREVLEEMSFVVDYDLLGERYTNQTLSFSFQPPQDWEDITDMVKDQINAGIEIDEDSVIPEILKIYGSDELRVMCTLFDYTPTLDGVDLQKETEQIIQEVTEGRSILKEGSYTYNGFKIHQLTLSDEGIVNIKLFITNENIEQLVLLEYYVDIMLYQDNVEVIESSIGSITKI